MKAGIFTRQPPSRPEGPLSPAFQNDISADTLYLRRGLQDSATWPRPTRSSAASSSTSTKSSTAVSIDSGRSDSFRRTRLSKRSSIPPIDSTVWPVPKRANPLVRQQSSAVSRIRSRVSLLWICDKFIASDRRAAVATRDSPPQRDPRPPPARFAPRWRGSFDHSRASGRHRAQLGSRSQARSCDAKRLVARDDRPTPEWQSASGSLWRNCWRCARLDSAGSHHVRPDKRPSRPPTAAAILGERQERAEAWFRIATDRHRPAGNRR